MGRPDERSVNAGRLSQPRRRALFMWASPTASSLTITFHTFSGEMIAMFAFLQTVGPWIVFGGLFYFMMRNGGCGMGHAHGGAHGDQQPRANHDGGVTSTGHHPTVVDTTASEVRIADLEQEIAALRGSGSSETPTPSTAVPAQAGGHRGCH